MSQVLTIYLGYLIFKKNNLFLPLLFMLSHTNYNTNIILLHFYYLIRLYELYKSKLSIIYKTINGECNICFDDTYLLIHTRSKYESTCERCSLILCAKCLSKFKTCPVCKNKI